MEDVKEFLEQLNITDEPIESDNGWVIDIDDDNTYSRYYSRLTKSELLDEDDDASQLTLDTSSLQFVGDDYTLILIADLNAENYRLVIRENN